MTVGTIAQVDPTTLTIAMNVRTDAKVDKEFVASIKQLGILQPPMVTPNADGGYDVVLGQRRTLAAVEAGLKTIPVYVVDQSEADAARVVDQLTENDQRQGLSEVERVAGYKQLSLFGLSPAQIVKRTARPKAVIEKALAVAGDEVASAALAEHELTLDEAAYLVEFSDDKAAVKKLVEAAGKGQLDHVVANLRRKRELVEHVATLQAELVKEKVIPMLLSESEHRGAQEGDPEGLVRLDKLGKPGAPTEPLGVKDVPKKALAGRVVQTWMSYDGGYGEWAKKQYFVLKPDAHGIPELEYARSVRELTPEEQEAEAVRDAELRARQEVRAARDAAAEVRWAWLGEFMQRKTLPDVLPFIARVMPLADPLHNKEAFGLLGITVSDHDDQGIVGAVNEFIAAKPQEAARLILATVLAAAESEVAPTVPWRTANLEVASVYLTQLDEWGYGLSLAEAGILADASAEAAESDDVEEYDEDEEEGDAA